MYVEKPVGHTILEGLAMVRAARANDRVVQVGTIAGFHPITCGALFCQIGKLGKSVSFARLFIPAVVGNPLPTRNLPKDWIGICEWTALCPYNPAMHPRGFRQFLDYANGTLGDWGIHWMDHITWFSEDPHPKKVSAMGGRHIKQDSTTAPDTMTVQFDYEDFTAVWEHRQYGANNSEKHPLGIYFYGTEGVLHIGWKDDGTTFYPSNRNREIINIPPKLHKPDDQIPELWADFMDSIKNKRRSVSDIEIGHHSTNLSLLGMLSPRLGRSIE